MYLLCICVLVLYVFIPQNENGKKLRMGQTGIIKPTVRVLISMLYGMDILKPWQIYNIIVVDGGARVLFRAAGALSLLECMLLYSQIVFIKYMYYISIFTKLNRTKYLDFLCLFTYLRCSVYGCTAATATT